jgi:hypothetical protein
MELAPAVAGEAIDVRTATMRTRVTWRRTLAVWMAER